VSRIIDPKATNFIVTEGPFKGTVAVRRNTAVRDRVALQLVGQFREGRVDLDKGTVLHLIAALDVLLSEIEGDFE
jgi:hypothetical protein